MAEQTETYEHVMTPEAIDGFVRDHFPAAHGFSRTLRVGEGRCRIRLQEPGEMHLRPGNTVSGPTLMTLADTAAYFCILSLIGPVALTVTTNLHIDFFRKPELGRIEAEARMLKLGKRLAVTAVELFADDALVANASVTYSIPPPEHRGG